MAGLTESAAAVMRAAARRLEVAASNISNASTAGYKTLRLRSISGSDYEAVRASSTARLEQGKLVQASGPLNVAINGPGFFSVRGDSGVVYTRSGAFRVAADGTVQTPQGLILQQSGGGDLVVEHPSEVAVEPDGTVLQSGQPIGRIAVFQTKEGAGPEPVDGSLFNLTGSPEETATVKLSLGMIEASNVSLGDEMTSVMAAMRSAETGAKLIQVYDDLMGRAATALGGK